MVQISSRASVSSGLKTRHVVRLSTRTAPRGWCALHVLAEVRDSRLGLAVFHEVGRKGRAFAVPCPAARRPSLSPPRRAMLRAAPGGPLSTALALRGPADGPALRMPMAVLACFGVTGGPGHAHSPSPLATHQYARRVRRPRRGDGYRPTGTPASEPIATGGGPRAACVARGAS